VRVVVRFLVEGEAGHLALAGVLQEAADYAFDVAHDGGHFHEGGDGLVQQGVLGGPHQFDAVGPEFEDCLDELKQGGTLSALMQVAGVDIEGNILQEIFEVDASGICKVGQ
jgi:hypothetical protein